MTAKVLGYGRQQIDEADIEAVVAVLRGDYLTQGPAVEAFEQALADYTGARFAVAVSNGTAALHLACLAAGLGEGDVGVTQAITFVASANCLSYCGARADLVDIDPETLNMSPDVLRAYLARTPECKAVIPVAMGGYSHDMAQIRDIAGDRVVIEDACHALGARDGEGAPVGAGAHADMTVFSFHPVKPITTGEGGAILTNREDLHRKLLALRSHGIVRGRDAVVDQDKADDPWYYEMQTLGLNYRLCDLQAALGASQLSRIDRFMERRRAVARWYDRRLEGMNSLRLVQNQPGMRDRSGHHIYVVRLDFAALGKTRAEVMNGLRARGVGTQVHYIPVHHQPYYRARFAGARFPAAEAYYDECLTLPCHPDLDDDDLERVASALQDVLAD